MLGRQRLIKVVSAIAVSMLSGGAAWGMTAATSSHSPRAAGTEVESSTSSSVDETSSTESTTSTTEATTTTDDSTTTTDDSTTTTEETTTTLATTPTSGPAPCNHGAEVSRVAHEAPTGDGNEHGKAVSEAAHHKCGDAADAADAADPTEKSDVESEHADAAEQGSEHGGGSGHD
jgi:cytoskeletal protein RodZ